MSKVKRNCDYCKKEYFADSRNLKRGWGLCCSKSCAAHKREKSRPDYDPYTVKRNNFKRKHGCFPEEYDEIKWIHDQEHPFSSEGLGQW